MMRGLSWRDLAYAGLHFSLGFSVGSLTFSSTWIIYRACAGEAPGGAVVACIVLFSLSASVVSHVLEDYFFSFF